MLVAIQRILQSEHKCTEYIFMKIPLSNATELEIQVKPLGHNMAHYTTKIRDLVTIFRSKIRCFVTFPKQCSLRHTEQPRQRKKRERYRRTKRRVYVHFRQALHIST